MGTVRLCWIINYDFFIGWIIVHFFLGENNWWYWYAQYISWQGECKILTRIWRVQKVSGKEKNRLCLTHSMQMRIACTPSRSTWRYHTSYGREKGKKSHISVIAMSETSERVYTIIQFHTWRLFSEHVYVCILQCGYVAYGVKVAFVLINIILVNGGDYSVVFFCRRLFRS
jgi:hypothetical protein